MGNEQNLIPGAHKLTAEEQSLGGRRSGEAKRTNKLLKECMEKILSLEVQEPKKRKILTDLGIENEEVNNKVLLVAALFNKVVYTGDVAAFKEIRNLIGEDDTKTEDTLAKLDKVLMEIEGNI